MTVILIVGGGGREHSLAWKLAQSPLVSHIYTCPGNAGTATSKITNVVIDYSIHDYSPLLSFAVNNNVQLVIPGPELPLVHGIESSFKKVGIPVFGPSQNAARMEGSKAFSKAFMARNNIPTASYSAFHASHHSSAQSYISHQFSTGAQNLVLKASGLASGKGVIIADSPASASNALSQITQQRIFGDAGAQIVIEEYLSGSEVSLLAISDGYTVLPFSPAQDHKRIGERDTGPNTGGMGAYTPLPAHVASPEEIRQMQAIVKKTIDAMRREGYPFVGLLFTGFMLTASGPKVLEYNVRFGDPETEALMLLLSPETDLAEIILACVSHRLDSLTLRTKPGSAVSLVLASNGYPNAYQKGLPISIDYDNIPSDIQIFHAGTSLTADNKVITNGGRVLVIAAYASTLQKALQKAYAAAEYVKFEGMVYRRDIAYRALTTPTPTPTPTSTALTYASAGVSIPAGNALVSLIKPLIKSTARPGSDASIGGFGGVFDLKAAGYSNGNGNGNNNADDDGDDTMLVSGTDGVGTKLRVAGECGAHDSVGIDLVAMCVNDLLVQGAEPLFFLDYYACASLKPDIAAQVVKGIVHGCKLANCALVGGETAEMPGMYSGDDYDIAGFAVGAVKRSNLLPKIDDIKVGDKLLGIPSSGLHSNGFSLVRKIVELSGVGYADDCPFPTTTTSSSSSSSDDSNIQKQKMTKMTATTLGEHLLTPTKIYTTPLLPLLHSPTHSKHIKALAHITGGGFIENIPRVLPATLGCIIRCSAYPLPEVFKWLMRVGNVEIREMARTFNLGIGMVVVIDGGSIGGGGERGEFEELVRREGMVVIGEVVEGSGVRLVDAEAWDV